ncbi:hypothetical protein DFH07DRAFT_812536, partial [Mycena maculata]
MSLNHFPLKLLVKIFFHLPYTSLLSVLAVCVKWNVIVAEDPALGVLMFKKLSKVSVGPVTSCTQAAHYIVGEPILIVSFSAAAGGP